MNAKVFATFLDPQMYNGGGRKLDDTPIRFFFNFDKTIDCKELERSVAVRLPFAEILMCQLCLYLSLTFP